MGRGDRILAVGAVIAVFAAVSVLMDRSALVLAFLVAGTLEVYGVWRVVADIRGDKVLQLLDVPVTEPVEMDSATLKKCPGSIASRKSQTQQDNELGRDAAETELVRTVLIETLKPDRGRYAKTSQRPWQRFIGSASHEVVRLAFPRSRTAPRHVLLNAR